MLPHRPANEPKEVGYVMSEYSVSNIKLINHIRDDLSKLTSTEKLAAVMLVSRRNSHSLQCNPSHNTIAKDMGVSRRTSINAINSLVKKRIISKFHDKSRSNHYLFYFDINDSVEVSENNPSCIFTEKEIARHL